MWLMSAKEGRDHSCFRMWISSYFQYFTFSFHWALCPLVQHPSGLPSPEDQTSSLLLEWGKGHLPVTNTEWIIKIYKLPYTFNHSHLLGPQVSLFFQYLVLLIPEPFYDTKILLLCPSLLSSLTLWGFYVFYP